MSLAAPPDPTTLEPLIAEVAEGTVLIRVHHAGRSAGQFNPGRGLPGRFHPFVVRGTVGSHVPTLYAASTVAGTLSETVFHDLPYRGAGKRVLISRLHDVVLSALVLRRPIRVARLAGVGLRRVGVRRRDLIEGGPGTYATTALWAAALHGSPSRPEGLEWVSRQDDTARAFVLFGDRVEPTHLEVVASPIPLATGPGLAIVEELAAAAGITVVR